MKVQTGFKKKKTNKIQTKHKKVSNFKTVNNSTINKNPGTLHHDCHRPWRDDGYDRSRGTSRNNSTAELESGGSGRKPGNKTRERLMSHGGGGHHRVQRKHNVGG